MALARLESRHVHGVGMDSRGDIYAGLTIERGVDKFVHKSGGGSSGFRSAISFPPSGRARQCASLARMVRRR